MLAICEIVSAKLKKPSRDCVFCLSLTQLKETLSKFYS